MGNLYGVIGCPISHSMSPDIHNLAFTTLNIDSYYKAFHIEPSQLAEAVEAMRLLEIKGYNVTIPHKVSIIPYLDELDVTAQIAGAVNTVVNVDGKLIGHNTDGNGYKRSLEEMLLKPLQDNKILIIGAGGAAGGIYYTLAHYGCRNIDITNRTLQTAEKLIEDCPYENNSTALSLMNAEAQLGHYDVVIQTTAVGLYPNINEQPISVKNAKGSAIISDIVYNPIKTAFLKEAEQLGLTIHNGVGMFVHQAAIAFELWTGQKPPLNEMAKVVHDKLGG